MVIFNIYRLLFGFYSLNIFIKMSNYIQRLKNKLKIKKLDSNQPIKAWLFVLILNETPFA